MNMPAHVALHPFERVPVLRHDGFTVYETSAIVSYVDDAFDGPNLTPSDPQTRAHMNQWISAVNAYYYPYLIYHVSHERNVFPQLGIASDEEVVAHAMPTVEICLQTLERELSRTGKFLIGPDLVWPIFHAADHPRLGLHAGSTRDVSAISVDLRMAGADGSLIHNEALPRHAAPARADRACPQMGRLAPAEILTGALACCTPVTRTCLCLVTNAAGAGMADSRQRRLLQALLFSGAGRSAKRKRTRCPTR